MCFMLRRLFHGLYYTDTGVTPVLMVWCRLKKKDLKLFESMAALEKSHSKVCTDPLFVAITLVALTYTGLLYLETSTLYRRCGWIST